ncbi:MAG: 1-acyl-sn-glycerol-3-phosphate acyltransferase [Atopobiaceae bacterium]|nr:1-acyl-sn-glycerol-3-phosphate acyltransferase [Atopobiaceae bacterium]
MKLIGNTHKDYNASAMAEYPLPIRAFVRLVVWVLWLFTKIVWPWRIDHAEKLFRNSASGGGVVVIQNHVSMLEPVITYISFQMKGRRIRPIYKSEYDRVRIVSWFLTVMGAIPVNRGSADMHAIRCAQHALERGEDILIYPEGTRIRSDDQPVEIHGGFALIAQMGKADIIPTAIVGARNITPKGKRIPRPKRVWLDVGDPIVIGEVDRKTRKARLAQVEEESMTAVYALRDALRRAHPGEE